MILWYTAIVFIFPIEGSISQVYHGMASSNSDQITTLFIIDKKLVITENVVKGVQYEYRCA